MRSIIIGIGSTYLLVKTGLWVPVTIECLHLIAQTANSLALQLGGLR